MIRNDHVVVPHVETLGILTRLNDQVIILQAKDLPGFRGTAEEHSNSNFTDMCFRQSSCSFHPTVVEDS